MVPARNVRPIKRFVCLSNNYGMYRKAFFPAAVGFAHGEHKVYPEEEPARVPAANLLLSILQSHGLEVDRIVNSLAAGGNHLRDLVHLVVQSEVFQTR